VFYRRAIEGHIIPRIGELPLQRLRRPNVNQLYVELLQSGGRDGRPLRPKTVRNTHIVLRRALADAVRWGELLSNPAQRTWSPPF
jgi:hypothetical protein